MLYNTTEDIFWNSWLMLSKEENQALPVFGFGIHVCRNLYLVFLSFGMISVVDCDPRYDNVRELSDLPRFILDEISNFSRTIRFFRVFMLPQAIIIPKKKRLRWLRNADSAILTAWNKLFALLKYYNLKYYHHSLWGKCSIAFCEMISWPASLGWIPSSQIRDG